ncbi:asparagine synthase (glutamine-hydrolyzing) [Halobellus captivus]|uniref:asparagine synthase (glutamine-hydrolyzing) n=1 Tax=Halobellus captivus TaxID=2592614 RepID=UPI0011A06509|nr:asparagine synthase (glutamine-hydrolyzing) [Halobellus captivus]
MCGIGGKISFAASPSVDIAEAMNSCMRHRGPDAGGVYTSKNAVLAHRRLSILDLSDAGRQPMANDDESVWIVFNGEIYNYQELRERLDGYSFRSETDTEVLLHLYEEYGVDCLSMLRGMFAFGIWDERRDRLFLARDRLGQKPLFYHRFEDGVTFGSTVRTVLADDSVEAAPDYRALREYFTYQYVPSPRTGFEEIRRVNPAEYVVVDESGMTRRKYWDVSHTNQSSASVGELSRGLREKFRESTRLRMRSDVPVGVFLSGGIDSTIVTGVMSELAEEPVNTYSIGFEEYDELEFARPVADEYGTNHHEHIVTPDALDALPDIVRHNEMPFGDPSALPTYYVSQAAAEDITVAVGGDAGDENFAGYDRYTYYKLTNTVHRLPAIVRGALRTAAAATIGPIREPARRGIRLLDNAAGDDVERYAPYVCHMTRNDVESFWTGPQSGEELEALRAAFERADGPTLLDDAMQVDLRTYLPDDLLVKVDRESMAHSLEVRSPFLDHKLVEFAATIPSKYKWRRGEKKWLLKRAFKQYLPDPVATRSKQGFSVPVNEWFRGELREYARDSLERLGARQNFDERGLQSLLAEHTSGANHGFKLWDLVVLEQWFEEFIDD